MTAFDPASIERFRFTGVDFDPATGTARLGYALEGATGRLDLVEEITFPVPAGGLDQVGRQGFERVLRLLHLLAGMSYYKAAAPPELVVDGEPPGPATAELLRRVYLHGLGEFAYTNGLDLADRLRFPATGDDGAAVALAPSPRALVAVGGGKDSLVSVETVCATGRPAAVAVVGTNPVIHRVATATGLEVVTVQRLIDPQLFELNRRGALNGHVAITAIVGAILLAAAVLRGDGAVVLSNERSASEGNAVRIGKLEVNHQYSKGLAYERELAAHLAGHVVRGVDAFSLLRPLSELAICRRFAELERYHALFTSCNANFRLTGDGAAARWCLACPKCRFVHLALAPFLDRARLVAIFGADLLADDRQTAGFRALLGVTGEAKPFECVGTFAEARAAIVLLDRHPEHRSSAVVRRLLAEHPEAFTDADRLVADALTPSTDHLVPAGWTAELDALLRAR